MHAQIGKFELGQRLATMALRGSQFFLVGFGSSALGHSLTIQLVSYALSRRQVFEVVLREFAVNNRKHQDGTMLTACKPGWHLFKAVSGTCNT